MKNPPAHTTRLPGDQNDVANTIDFAAIISGVRRQWKIIAASIVATLVLAVIYLVLTPKMYAGTAVIETDFRYFASSTSGESAELVFSTTTMDSEVEILKSQHLALSVINELKLLQDGEFVNPSLLGRIVEFATFFKSKSVTDPKSALTMRALARFVDRLTITRVNKTFLLQIDFLSTSPQKAADIANALVRSYLNDELDARLESSTRASGWMQERIQELQKRSLDADLEVQKYRDKNNLVTAGGRLINDQQLSELSTQLSAARADVTIAQAKCDHIRWIIDNKQTTAAVSEELNNPIITGLRNHLLDASKLRADLVARVGPNHAQVIILQRQISDYERQIFSELGRIGEANESDLRVAKIREQSLSDSLSRLEGNSSEDNRMMIDLQQRQQAADAYRTLSKSFLERYQELVQQQSSPVTQTRVISRAIAPASPSQPQVILILAASLFCGIAVGSGAAMLREFLDRTFRTGADVRSELAVDFLGILPVRPPKVGTARKAPIMSKIGLGVPAIFRVSVTEPFSRFADTIWTTKVAKAVQPPKDGMARKAPIMSKIGLGVPAIFRMSVTEPFSRFADTIRTTKVAIDDSSSTGRGRLIGIVSTGMGEGKTVTCANIAFFCAETAAKTLLIDGDLRKRGLSKGLAQDAVTGIVDAVHRPVNLYNATIKLSEYLWMLPASKACETANSSEVLRSIGMERFLAAASEEFDYIVIDLPPLVSLIDARAIAPLLTCFLFVVEWGRTPRSLAHDVLLYNPIVHEKCVGAVLNKVDPYLILHYAPYGVEAKEYGTY